MVTVVHGNSDIGKSQRFSGLCTGKNNVLHIASTKLLGALLSQYPAHRIAYIALTAAVRADNSRNSVMEFKYNFIGKRLKSLYLNAF